MPRAAGWDFSSFDSLHAHFLSWSLPFFFHDSDHRILCWLWSVCRLQKVKVPPCRWNPGKKAQPYNLEVGKMMTRKVEQRPVSPCLTSECRKILMRYRRSVCNCQTDLLGWLYFERTVHCDNASLMHQLDSRWLHFLLQHTSSITLVRIVSKLDGKLVF